MTDLRIDFFTASAELMLRDDHKFEYYFTNFRPGCVVDFTSFADHLNVDGGQRLCRIL